MARDLALLHPETFPVFKSFLDHAVKDGHRIMVVQTLRTREEQEALYGQGRQSTVLVNRLRKIAGLPPIRQEDNKVVTNAKPGSSWHEYGCAIDVCYLDGRARAVWDGPACKWETLGALGMGYMLIWGGTFKGFKDRPHFEYHPGGVTLAEMKLKYPHGYRPEGQKES